MGHTRDSRENQETQERLKTNSRETQEVHKKDSGKTTQK